MEHNGLAKDITRCSGCGACMVVCPKSAIQMKLDALGCLYPQIDEELCINCGKCMRVCPYCETPSVHTPQAVYAAVGKCQEKVARSASGGIFASMADSCISKGGMVAGAVLNCENSRADVYHLLSGSREDLPRMQGSKYVQSEAWRCYAQIMQVLRLGQFVLFSGTPCQAAAVKSITGDPDNLVTVDLICHGVPPLQMLNDYLKILSKRLCGKIVGFRFRDKSCTKPFTAAVDLQTGRKTKRIFMRSGFLSFYKYFLNGSLYRENCYSCPYACAQRVSDITIGDYWGIEECHIEDLESGRMLRRNDWSCILVNTEKGAKFLEEHGGQILMYPSRLEWVTQKNEQLKAPSPRGEKRELLLKAYREHGYKAVEAVFLKENRGRIRFFWRLIRSLRENNRTIGEWHEN